MSGTYTDAGWSGTPAAISAALAGFGYQVNTDATVTVIDPSKAGPIVAVTGYHELDGTAYVLIRTSAAIPLPAGVTAIGPQTTAAISGVFMAGPDAPPSTIPAVEFFNRFTPAETQAVSAIALASPPVFAGLVNGLAAGQLDLTSPTLQAWMDGLVAAGALTADRKTIILTP